MQLLATNHSAEQPQFFNRRDTSLFIDSESTILMAWKFLIFDTNLSCFILSNFKCTTYWSFSLQGQIKKKIQKTKLKTFRWSTKSGEFATSWVSQATFFSPAVVNLEALFRHRPRKSCDGSWLARVVRKRWLRQVGMLLGILSEIPVPNS